MIIASTFISGFSDVVEFRLKQQIHDLKIHTLLDGLVVYETAAPIDKIKRFRFFSNSFLVIEQFQRKELHQMAANVDFTKLPRDYDADTFRIIYSQENEMIPMNETLTYKLESTIANITRLRTNKRDPDLEFWFLKRSEGFGFFGLRLTRHPSWDRILQKGELRPDLAQLLAIIADVKAKDIVLDPFTGHGAIPNEISRWFKYERLIANDKDVQAINYLKTKLKDYVVEYRTEDALNIRSIQAESIDKIITDPPWGNVEKTDAKFYDKMFTEFYRVLKPEGICVLLLERNLENIIDKKKFEIKNRYDVLVSGKKATVFLLNKVV